MNIQLLKDLYQINSKSRFENEMIDFIVDWAEARAKDPDTPYLTIDMDATGNLLITSGISDSYPCLCAHMDEVHAPIEDKRIIQYEDFVFGFNPIAKRMAGIGADDKNGIFIALSALDLLPAVKLLFTVEEETGGFGAEKVNIQEWLHDVRYVIQCDRRGSSDFITNAGGVKLASKEFSKDAKAVLKKYGFKETSGCFTDVQVLKTRKLNVSCCNLSCGYHNPHMNDEITVISELENTFNAVVELCMLLVDTYQHQHVAPTYVQPVGSSTADYSINDKWEAYFRNRQDGFWRSPDRGFGVCYHCIRATCYQCPYADFVSDSGVVTPRPLSVKNAFSTEKNIDYRTFDDHREIYD